MCFKLVLIAVRTDLRVSCVPGCPVQRPLRAGEPPLCGRVEPPAVGPPLQLAAAPGRGGVQAVPLPGHRAHSGDGPKEAFRHSHGIQCKGTKRKQVSPLVCILGTNILTFYMHVSWSLIVMLFSSILT